MNRYAKSIIASGHPQVSEAAAEILRAGGNAFDAVVAARFASAVVEPTLTSLGGGSYTDAGAVVVAVARSDAKS